MEVKIFYGLIPRKIIVSLLSKFNCYGYKLGSDCNMFKCTLTHYKLFFNTI